jgi:glutaconyl-CoA/methylmalonyl-CoA decarboxylase subunit delta
MKLLLNMMVFDPGLIDEFALVLALVGYVVVFAALVALIIVFNNLPRILNFDFKKYFRKRKLEEIPEREEVSVTGEVNAAISAALFLYFGELHDEESGVITIKKISRRYSPWSSKIYGLRHIPRN